MYTCVLIGLHRSHSLITSLGPMLESSSMWPSLAPYVTGLVIYMDIGSVQAELYNGGQPGYIYMMVAHVLWHNAWPLMIQRLRQLN